MVLFSLQWGGNRRGAAGHQFLQWRRATESQIDTTICLFNEMTPSGAS
jgi:hypothetical protein